MKHDPVNITMVSDELGTGGVSAMSTVYIAKDLCTLQQTTSTNSSATN